MLNKHLILHLTLIEDIGPAIIQKITQRSDVNASDLYLFSVSDWMNVFGFTAVAAEKLFEGLQNKKILEYELTLIAQHTIQWLTIDDPLYPSLLREIYLPPYVLYAQGDVVDNKHNSLAIVGARKADAYGQHVINTIVPDLVAAQYTIVSGGARGIDTMAHEATIRCGGKTIAILGSGLLMPYPLQNKKLFETIVDNGGALVSSFPLTMEALPGHFPARNRIITGLSRGCLVVQAAEKSGALISAHYAMEQGREVFAVPGPFDNELSAGCNTLIQNGAKLVMKSADILTEFGDRVIIPQTTQTMINFNNVPHESGVKTPDIINYSAQQKLIIAACKQPASFDAIINTTQLTVEAVQAELFNLQLDGVVEQDFTGRWVAQ